ncbi:MAG: hypothetical protein LBL31_00545 [Spirochaetaceae bacterium]|jgi:hypothetical protein|nr:hypothetical protein [Spirochaetaceae bacterium]
MKKILSLAVLAVSWMAASCDWGITEEGGPDLVKPPVVLQLTVTNSMNAPIDVQIRHRYEKYGVISYSDWIKYDILAGGGSLLDGETAAFMKDGKETECTGFVLLDDALNRYFGFEGSVDCYSSFELKVTAGGKVIQLAGYESEAPGFAETRLCDLWLEVVAPSAIWRKVLLFDKPTNTMYRLDEPTLLTASLLIKADGTYVFDMEPPGELPEY